MTRRLEPLERARELGDASVPFPYDVHALLFSDDAVTLENQLHKAFANRRVNFVNERREFFFSTPGEVRELLEQHAGGLLEFTGAPSAPEYHRAEAAGLTSLPDIAFRRGVHITYHPTGRADVFHTCKAA